MKAFVPAAGFGKRMGPLTADTPKPLLPLGGYPLITYALFRLHRWGVQLAVVNGHYLSEQLESYLRNFPHFEVVFSFEPEILGTAGGVRNCLHLLGGDPFLILNPDTVLLPAPEDAPPRQLSAGDAAGLLFVAPRHDDSQTGWSLAPASGQLRPDEAGAFFYIGYGLLHPASVSHLPPGEPAELGPIWMNAGRNGRLLGRSFAGKTVEAGTRQAYMNILNTNPIAPTEEAAWKHFVSGWPSRR